MPNLDNVPRWFLVMLAVTATVLFSAIGKQALADIDATKKESAETALRVTQLEKRFDRFEDKIDRIGDRLGVKA